MDKEYELHKILKQMAIDCQKSVFLTPIIHKYKLEIIKLLEE